MIIARKKNWHAKADKPRENEAKTSRSRNGTWTKRGDKSYFEYKFHSITNRDYETIREFETTTASFRDSKVELSERNEVVYRDRWYFGAKSKGYDKTMKGAVNEHPLGMSCILRNNGSSQKEL